MFRRLGLALKILPVMRRKEILGLLVEGVAPTGGRGAEFEPVRLDRFLGMVS